STFRRSFTPCTPLWPAVSARLAKSASRLASTSQTYDIFTSLRATRLLRWFVPIPPQPMSAMFSTSAAAALATAAEDARAAAVVAAAEVCRKSRRVTAGMVSSWVERREAGSHQNRAWRGGLQLEVEL